MFYKARVMPNVTTTLIITLKKLKVLARRDAAEAILLPGGRQDMEAAVERAKSTAHTFKSLLQVLDSAPPNADPSSVIEANANQARHNILLLLLLLFDSLF